MSDINWLQTSLGIELDSHVLEVPPSFAASKPEIHVYPLGIGGKADPARLVFDSIKGDGLQITMCDWSTCNSNGFNDLIISLLNKRNLSL